MTTITCTFLPRTMIAVRNGSELSKRVSNSEHYTSDHDGIATDYWEPLIVHSLIHKLDISNLLFLLLGLIQRQSTTTWFQNTTQTSGWMVNGGVASKQRNWRRVAMHTTHWAMVCLVSSLGFIYISIILRIRVEQSYVFWGFF